MRTIGLDAYEDEVPKYIEISRKLAEEIRCKYRPGDIMPSEQELAKRFKVNRHTLRAAIEALVNCGMVGRYQGKGTVVQQQLISYPIHSGTRFSETLEKSGRRAESQVLRKIGIPAPTEVAEALRITVAEPVILLEALRKMDGAPFSISSHYFPLEGMFEVMRKYENGSLHAFITDTYGMHLVRISSLISAILPDKNDAEILAIQGSSPILRVKSVNVDSVTEVPVEFVVSRFRGMSTEISVQPASPS